MDRGIGEGYLRAGRTWRGAGLSPGTDLVLSRSSETIRWYTVNSTMNLLDGFLLRKKTNIVASPPLNVLTARLDHAHGFYRVRAE